MAQRVFPYCVVVLGNVEETAPETWGDGSNLKQATTYNEKADIFSFGIIMWRLFVGSRSHDKVLPYPSCRGGNVQLRSEIHKVIFFLLVVVTTAVVCYCHVAFFLTVSLAFLSGWGL